MTFTGIMILVQFQFLFLLTFWSYLMAKFSDPGYMSEKIVSTFQFKLFLVFSQYPQKIYYQRNY